MICESFISYKKTNFSLETANKIKTHLNSIYPKINFNKNDLKEILSLMKYDKKNYLKNIRFSLLKDVGKVEVDVEIDENLILDSFDFYSN
jgi:3-dehydroquinate synthase